MDPEAQLMAQALSGQGGPPLPNSDVSQLQASPGFPKNLSPEALAALFLVPTYQNKYGYDDRGRRVLEKVQTQPGQSGMYNIVNDQGKNVGFSLMENRPEQKKVYVTYMQGGGDSPLHSKGSAAAKFNDWAHSLGTKELRSLLRSAAETFPQADVMEGVRISGAKSAESGHAPVTGATQTFNLARLRGGQGGAMPGTRLTDLW